MRRSITDKTDGFTVTQFLVVLVIIVVVVILLAPVFAKAREGRKRMQCMKNLICFGFAYSSYRDDFGPKSSNPKWPPSITGETNIENVAAALAPYVSYSSILWACPSVATNVPKTPYTSKAPYTGLITYTWFPGGVLPDEISDGVFTITTLHPLFWDKGNPAANGHGSNVLWSATSAHKGDGGNVLWNDGHVDWRKTMNSTYGSVTLTNCQNQ